jgi:dTMP kinase
MPLFISFEGGEGAGKSTQAALLAQRLKEAGREIVALREPGGTPVGENVRRWVKGVALAPETELLLFAAARAELVATVIRPSLEAGKDVIADRYADSTMAYQSYGRRLPLDLVRAVNQAATRGLMPHITFLLDQPVERGLARVGKPQLGLALEGGPQGPGRMDEAGQSKFEREGIAFHRRVRSGYLKLAGEEPQRILVMDASQPAERIAQAVWERVQRLIEAQRR